MKKLLSGVVGVVGAIVLFVAVTGGFNDKWADATSKSELLNGNDTGSAWSDNEKTFVTDDTGNPLGEVDESGDVEYYTKPVEEETADESNETAGLDDVFSIMEPEEETVGDEWWSQDRHYCWFNSGSGDEIDVTVHWIAEDLGEIRFDFSDGSSSGACTFETDGMWNYFEMNGEEAKFYIDESSTPESLHLFRGEVGEEEEIVFDDLEWLQQNAG